MELGYEQRQRLTELLTPQFQNEAQRQVLISQVFKDEPNIIALLAKTAGTATSATEFTSALLTQLLAKNYQMQSGDPAIIFFLKTMQTNNGANGLAAELQPFIDTLKMPVKPTKTVSTPSRRRHRHRSPIKRGIKMVAKQWKLIIVVLLVMIIVPSASVIVFASDAYGRVQDSIVSLKRVADSLNRSDFSSLTMEDLDRLQVSVQNVSNALFSAQEQTRLLQQLSFVNPDLHATFQMMNAGGQIALSAQNILTGLQPTLFFLSGGQESTNTVADISSGERVIELLQTGRGQFITAQAELAASQSILDGIDASNLSPQLILQLEQVKLYQDNLTKINQALVNLPDVLSGVFGMDNAKNYLVLSQNSDELRPSGGYISTWGWVRIQRFHISDYGYDATTTISPNPPSESLASQLNIPDWWFAAKFAHPIYSAWDGSWSADFPTTASMSAWYYDQGQNPRSPVDGVMAIDLAGMQDLLGAIGPVTVPDYNEKVSADNFRDVVYEIRAETGQHKAFLAATFEQIFAQWQNIDQRHSAQLLTAVLSALREKHIMLYFKDPKLNDIADLLGWSGKQLPGNYDYLMVADANLGNKSNSSIVRQLTYDVTIQPDGSLQSRSTISYDYPSSLADKDPAVQPAQYGNQKDYFNTMQVFLPKGITVTNSDNMQSPLKVVPKDTMTLLVTDTQVAFNASERYQFSYTNPAIVESVGPYKRYRLLIQKQPGTPGDRVSIQITLPPNAQIISASPDPAASYTLNNPILEFQTQLNVDQWIEVIYK